MLWCMALVAQLLITCVWAWWLVCKIGLGYYDDQMLCARHWANECWLNAWTDASGLMSVTWCAACGYAVQTVLLMGEGLGMGQASQNVGKHVVRAAS